MQDNGYGSGCSSVELSKNTVKAALTVNRMSGGGGGQVLPRRLLVLTGHRGGRVGKHRVGRGLPSGADELQEVDDQRRWTPRQQRTRRYPGHPSMGWTGAHGLIGAESATT